MASRPHAVETDALRGASDDQATQRRPAWGLRVGVVAAVGVMVCVGAVVASTAGHEVRPSTMMQLRGTPPQPWEAPGPDDENAGPEGLKEMLMERFGLAGGAPTTPVEPSPGSPSKQDNKAQLKKELLKEFGVTETSQQHGQNAGASDSLLTSNDPEDVALRTKLKHELRDKLMAALMPEQMPLAGADVPRSDWNWLQPAADSYSQLSGDADAERIDVVDVLQHLRDQRASRTNALADEMYQVDAQYAHTLNCFLRGTKQMHKLELSRDEYEELIEWMNAKCETTEGGGDENEASDSSATAKAGLEKAMSDHFDRLVGDFSAGDLDSQHALAQAKAIRAKIAACVARATEQAADANGRVDESKLNSSLDWVVTQCASLPSL